MKIHSMTATFGKLEHEKLVLEPGLNVITAHNEWGKSTWCAFLAAMLYGLDTRAKSTKTSLADKERYAPWSGSPMSGRMELRWQGRDITIERTTRGRVPLGEFRAFETESGLPVEELTAANCGEKLLGVEQSVFRRAGFIRLNDLPVTQDEALRRRLNALVTTGDESGAADTLAERLKELKNRCRYNRTGLLPQAEQALAGIGAKIAEARALEEKSRQLREQLGEAEAQLTLLRNHRQALRYAEAEKASAQAARAGADLDRARQELRKMEAACADLPSREEAEEGLGQLRSLREEWSAAQAETPAEPVSEKFGGIPLDEAREMVQEDGKRYSALAASKLAPVLLILGAVGILPAVTLLLLKVYLFGAAAGAVSLLALIWGFFEGKSRKKQMADLVQKYGTADVTHWVDAVRTYEEGCQRKQEADARMVRLRQRTAELCGDWEPGDLALHWQKALAARDGLEAARREFQRSESHLETIRAMVRPAQKPDAEDLLDISEEETARLLADWTQKQQDLQNRLGRNQGAMAALGDMEVLEAELDQKQNRIARLDETYAALNLALETLEEARTELQRRFAPRITRRAKELLGAMTGGRYHSLTMGADLSLQAGAGKEDVLHDAIWRSDGTLDQLYLALRLAVAQELTPGAPLVLDDALVRFDDERLAAVMEILQDLAKDRQIILFSCQSREENLI